MSWLDLSWNSFDSESGARLADALAVNQTLTSIDLSANSLRDAGGQRIAAALLHNKNLQEIFLSLNNIGGKSCFIFSKVSSLYLPLSTYFLNSRFFFPAIATCHTVFIPHNLHAMLRSTM